MRSLGYHSKSSGPLKILNLLCKIAMTNDYRLQLNVVGWTLCGIAIIVVAARTYCRHFLIHSFGPDDALMMLALVCGFLWLTLK